ncbi:MAG: hypothetical protein R3C53_13395 [Pirellulaceae bacterium]
MKNFKAADMRWEIDRYLLNDPSFDSAAFEARMLDDETLALTVADELARIQQITHAAQLSSASEFGGLLPQAPRLRQFSAANWLPAIMLAVAASVALALAVLRIGDGHSNVRAPTDDAQLTAIAQNWLAFDTVVQDRPSENTEFVPQDFAIQNAVFENTVFGNTAFENTVFEHPADPVEDVNSEDWVMAASAFFSEADI